MDLTDEQIDRMIWPAPLTDAERELVRYEYANPDPSGRSEPIYQLCLELWQRAALAAEAATEAGA